MNKCIVFQSDFGLSDGAVSAMKGVALCVDETLRLFDITHNIPPFDTYEGSFRLFQTLPLWPQGTVFVSVVDPGVGSKRRSLVAKTKSGHYIVTPDNGTLTHIYNHLGIDEVREIKEEVGHRKNAGESHTFHGRDVYSYTGALLASGQISFNQVGKKVPLNKIKLFKMTKPSYRDGKVKGIIETLDVRFGSLWTNIPKKVFDQMKLENNELVEIVVYNDKSVAYRSIIKYVHTFAEVEVGEVLCYINSMDCVGIAINRGNFAKAYNIGTREPWRIELIKK